MGSAFILIFFRLGLVLILFVSPVSVLAQEDCEFGVLEAPFGGLVGKSVCDIAEGGVVNYFQIIINALTAIIIAVGLIVVTIGGYYYMTAGGNADRISRSKSLILGAISGIALALLAYTILNFISPQFAEKAEQPKLVPVGVPAKAP